MIHSVQISRFGGPETLAYVQLPQPVLFPNGVRVQVKAAGVNFADIMMRMGLYPEAPRPPFVPGYEIAGVVIEVGKEVKNLKPGDRVLGGTRFGGYTSEIVLAESQLRKIPDRLTDIEAASIPVNFMTAWVGLHEMARVKKGDRVLIHSAAGGVGIAAVQMAAQAGATVVGLVGSPAKKDKVKSLGASEVLLTSEWEKGSNSDTGGFQVILDSTGGESLKRGFKRLAPGGRIVSFGVASVVEGQKRSIPKLLSMLYHTFLITPFQLMMENKGVFGLNLLQLFKEPQPGQPDLISSSLNEVLKRFEDGSYRTVVGKEFPLSQAGSAHTHLQSRSNIGKVVLTIE